MSSTASDGCSDPNDGDLGGLESGLGGVESRPRVQKRFAVAVWLAADCPAADQVRKLAQFGLDLFAGFDLFVGVSRLLDHDVDAAVLGPPLVGVVVRHWAVLAEAPGLPPVVDRRAHRLTAQ